MKRITDGKAVHFVTANANMCLCGEPAQRIVEELLGPRAEPFATTDARVNCPKCAAVYCAIKNAPWNQVEDDTLDRGIFDAVKVGIE